VVLKYTGRLDEAARLYALGHTAFARRLGRAHPDAATVFQTIGGLAHAAGCPVDEAPAREALSIRHQTSGPSHWAAAADAGALAAILIDTGRDDDAEALLELAPATFQRCLGRDHPGVAVALGGLPHHRRATRTTK
jgi:hypothetical protein